MIPVYHSVFIKYLHVNEQQGGQRKTWGLRREVYSKLHKVDKQSWGVTMNGGLKRVTGNVRSLGYLRGYV